MERIPHAPPLPCHPERSGERDVSRGVERVLRASVPVTNSFAVFGTAHRSVQDPSTDARDDKDGFCFQRSFDSLCSLRMTGRSVAGQRHFAGEALVLLLPSPFLRGKGDRLRWMRVVVSLSPAPLFRHCVTPSPQGEGKGRKRIAQACRGAFFRPAFFEIRLPFALRYAILKMAHNFIKFSTHRGTIRHFVSLFLDV